MPYSNWAGCTAVNQGVDRVRLVSVVIGKDLGREVCREVGDQLGEIVADNLGVGVAQAECIPWLCPAVGGKGGASEEGSGPDEN